MKIRELSEKDLKKISAGGENEGDPTPEKSAYFRDMILNYIEQGNDLMARGVYEAAYWEMESEDKVICQGAFFEKFGYPIYDP